MCRLFGMSGSPRRTHATFWLLDAPDSLSDQAGRPDGTGLGYFDANGAPRVHKAPVAAYENRCFAAEAREVVSTTFLAHIRFASTGGLEQRNTHPFEQDGRLFAHNGVLENLDELDTELGPDLSLVHGDTDSERFFALITREVRAHGGDVADGIVRAARWIADRLPVYSLNMIVTTADGLWALRYPETHGLYVLERRRGGQHGDRHPRPLRHRRSPARPLPRPGRYACGRGGQRTHGRQPRLASDGGRRSFLHVGPDLGVTRTIALPHEPRHRLDLADLRPEAAASQQTA